MYESNQLGMNQLCIIRKEKNITVKSPTLSRKKMWLKMKVIPILKAGFVRFELGPTQILRWYQSLSKIY